jgi:SAM-dependent methyltransferase
MILNRIASRANITLSRAVLQFDPSRERFTCPLCEYEGVFLSVTPETGKRRNALCPRCRNVERHRLQWLVVKKLREERDFSKLRVLHIAPEHFISNLLRSISASYLSADLYNEKADRREDLTSMSFPDQSFDLVYCSHVLEHIQDDRAAISEIRRVLSPQGIAILPVPILANITVEYSQPNPHEAGHVRAPGMDYFDRFKHLFQKVDLWSSADFDPRYQLFIYEDRSRWPTPTMPNRPSSAGVKHLEYVPVCRV